MLDMTVDGGVDDILGAHDIRLDRLDVVVLGVDGRRGTGKVVDAVHFDANGLDDVVTDEFKPVVIHQMNYVVFRPCKEVIKTKHVMPFGYQAIAEVFYLLHVV